MTSHASLPSMFVVLMLLGGCSIRTREIVERPTIGEALAALERIEPTHGDSWRSDRDAILANARGQVAQLKTSEPMYFGFSVHRAEVEQWGPSFYAGASEEKPWLDRALEAGVVTREECDRLIAAIADQSRDPLVRQENAFVLRSTPADDRDLVARAAGRADARGAFALASMTWVGRGWPRWAVFWIAPGGARPPESKELAD